jgi:hypothetical protein
LPTDLPFRREWRRVSRSVTLKKPMKPKGRGEESRVKWQREERWML